MRNYSSKFISIPTVLSAVFFLSCSEQLDRDFKQDMRNFVQGISQYAKSINPEFIVIPQNGQELVTLDGNENGPAAIEYLLAIDGVGREDLNFGYDTDDKATPSGERAYMIAFLDTAMAHGADVLVTDYCRTQSKIDSSYSWNSRKGYISFAADHRDLDNIPQYPPTPHNVNTADIVSLSEAKNFLYILDPTVNFSSKDDFIAALAATNYDAFIIDFFYDESASFSATDVAALKNKTGGGSRLVLCYMSIGEAEDYRYYWKSSWKKGSPEFIEAENPDWEGNYKVRYWDKAWQDIVFGNEASYLKKILNAGFDGVYLDIIDAFEYFEEEYE